MRLKIDNITPMGAVRTTQRAKYKSDSYKRYKRYKRDIRLYANQLMGNQEPTECAVSVDITFYMPIPKSRKNKLKPGDPHVVKPDIDNLIKGVFDAINGKVWKDDNQVMRVNAKKVYSDTPGILMEVIPLF